MVLVTSLLLLARSQVPAPSSSFSSSRKLWVSHWLREKLFTQEAELLSEEYRGKKIKISKKWSWNYQRRLLWIKYYKQVNNQSMIVPPIKIKIYRRLGEQTNHWRPILEYRSRQDIIQLL